MNEFETRLKVLGGLMVVIIALLIARAGYLQVYRGDEYVRRSDGNRTRLVPTVASRGTFFDRNGQSIVENRPSFVVSLLPLTAPIQPEVITRLSALLQVPREEIEAKVKAHTGYEPIRVKNDVGPELLTVIEEQSELYPGVIIEVQAVRDYLYKTQGAHILGYVSEISEAELERRKDEGYKTGDIIGQFGLERVYDQELRGVNGGELVEVDVTGKPVQILGQKEPVSGHDLYLTIDWRLQAATEKAVDDQLALIGAKAAAAVVMNPQTGEVLALVSRPAFDPNLFVHGISEKNWQAINENPYDPLDNKATTGEYPPGSTFKIVTGTAALSEEVVTPTEQILDTGVYWLGEKGNAGGEVLGWLDFTSALAHSDNYYFYEMGYRLGVDRLEKYARMFGLGEKTGINLPYESEGLVPSRAYKEKYLEDEWYDSETLDAAIGQGFNLVTPLQAAMVMGEIAANGQRFQPYLVSKIVDTEGNLVKAYTPKLLSALEVPDNVIRLVQQGLRDVTKEGTAAGVFGTNFPVDIAGKTGTAENSQGADHGWFVAYGPYSNPGIVVAVIVENGGFGSQSAVPIGKRILEAAFGLDGSVPVVSVPQKKQG
ncbi:MAG: penicillin-binding protein 2 [Schwartzia sp.]|nr:penicillin-binding protein 2 [Schwartzia sp. (in: firmicutes)]